MKHMILLLAITAFFSQNLKSQNYLTKTGTISFFSAAPLENIEAVNKQVTAMLNPSTGEVAFKVLIKSFVFEKALMQEHFNENYMESDKYPDSRFSGKVTDFKKIDLKKDGVYPVVAEGDLTIHGVTKKISAPGTIEVKEGKLHIKSKFNVAVADYNITIPKAVANNIAKNIDITVDCLLSQN